MSLFKRVHVVTVPEEFLEADDPETQLRFSQLNAKKMAKANLKKILDGIERGNVIMAQISDEQRQALLDRQRTQDAESTKPTEDTPEEPDSFDSFDQHTLVALAHVQHQPDTGTAWTEFSKTEIDDLLCFEWLAGEIYDVSKPKSAKEREGNS